MRTAAPTGDPNCPGLPPWPAFDEAGTMSMLLDGSPRAAPLPNQDKLKAFDGYYAWRREISRT